MDHWQMSTIYTYVTVVSYFVKIVLWQSNLVEKQQIFDDSTVASPLG